MIQESIQYVGQFSLAGSQWKVDQVDQASRLQNIDNLEKEGDKLSEALKEDLHEKEELVALTEGNYTRDKENLMEEVQEATNELITGTVLDMRERREKKRKGSTKTQVPLLELPKPEVEVEELLMGLRGFRWHLCKMLEIGVLCNYLEYMVDPQLWITSLLENMIQEGNVNVTDPRLSTFEAALIRTIWYARDREIFEDEEVDIQKLDL
ncbi:hypothetical protein Ancab_026381 [Ancistrocladus abbreviatus]